MRIAPPPDSQRNYDSFRHMRSLLFLVRAFAVPKEEYLSQCNKWSAWKPTGMCNPHYNASEMTVGISVIQFLYRGSRTSRQLALIVCLLGLSTIATILSMVSSWTKQTILHRSRTATYENCKWRSAATVNYATLRSAVQRWALHFPR